MILEQLNGEEALTYIAETPEEAVNMAFFTVGAEITCGLSVDMANPVESRVYLICDNVVLSNFEYQP